MNGVSRGMWAGLSILLLQFLAVRPACAVPSFARQTGMACEACHTVFPELNHYGRMFKASGYTLDDLKPVEDITANRQQMLSLTELPPISLMVQASETWLSKQIPDSVDINGHAQNGTVALPQQISLFYAGKIAPRIGAFIQLTYGNDSGTFGMDNVDLRYANDVVLPNEQSLLYGVTINNNPTVQDLWNSTPAFGFPFAASNANVSPLAAAQIDGTLGQDVAGVSAYLMWRESLYGEIGLYRSAKQGAANPITGAAGPLDGSISNIVRGTAPYFRVAYEYQWGRHSLEVGMYGARFRLQPGGGDPTAPAPWSGLLNEFKDVAQDFQYQYIAEDHLFTLAGTRIHENMRLDASVENGGAANARDDLTTWRLTGTYYFRRKIGGSLQVFSTTGSMDAALYPAGDPGVVVSANGRPDTRGFMAELNYMPWLNTKLSLQYTAYSRFNGSRDDYDGFGRKASDNNTVYALIWFAY
ncbi:MAG: hypothetical protein U1F35_03345 [Steroidobacteraceae bacterium]